jgi:hypothetical protein
MTINELIQQLSEHDLDKEVMILDGFNGGGQPREINIGPTERVITTDNAGHCFDCEHLLGAEVIVLGFGSY